MANYENLVQIETKPKIKKNKVSKERGCDNCTCKKGWKYGFGPVMGKVKGKKLFIWAQNPGTKEVRKKKELIGPTGEILWHELAKFGVKREDCDIQNAVRCLPSEKDEFGYRVQRNKPDKTEVHACSIYTEAALEKSRAKVHLILGMVAAQQVLGREYQKGKKIIWSEKLKAKVVITDHPAYFLYSGKKGQRFEEFKDALGVAAKEAFGKKIKTPKGLERFGYLLEQQYIKVQTRKEAKAAYKDILWFSKRKRIISSDFEWKSLTGLVYGFCPKPGLTYVFILDHPANLNNPDRKKVRKYVEMILTDKNIKKSFHHGCSDVPQTKKIYGWKVRNFFYDTELGAYFYDSSIKAYGLQKLVDRWFPEFSGWKEVTMPEAVPDGVTYKKGRKYGELDYSRVPIDKLVLYNGADCDIAKRIELKTKDAAPIALMHVYRDASFTINKMQRNGPLLDYQYHGLLSRIFPIRRKESLEELRRLCKKWLKKFKPKKIARDEKHLQKLIKLKEAIKKGTFNPKSVPNQLQPFMYDVLKLNPPSIYVKGKEVEVSNTRATTLDLLKEEYPNHPFLVTLDKFREDDSITTKGLKSFKKSADLHNKRLTTNWWLTGTITFRLRSGGKQDDVDHQVGIINLQNIPKNKMVKNLIISDENWYKMQAAWSQQVFERYKKNHDYKKLFLIDEKKKERTPEAIAAVSELHKQYDDIFTYEEFLDLYVFLAFDFSQMEVRVLAQMSEDPKLIEFFEQGVDIHSAIGSVLTGWTIEKIKNDADTRAACKSIIFAIIYGKQHKGLYQQLVNEGVKISFERVGELLEAFWKRFKRVKELMDHFKEQAEKYGYVETLFGARRPIGEDDTRGTFTGNQAVNSPIQGTAHQISVIAMALLYREMKRLYRLQDLQMEVHDALDWRLKIKYLPEANVLASKLLTQDVLRVVKEDFGIKWKVPLKAEGEAGLRLGTMVKLGKEVNLKYWANEWCLVNESRKRDVRAELKKVA